MEDILELVGKALHYFLIFQLNFKPFVAGCHRLSLFVSEPTEVTPLHNSETLELS